MAEDGSNCPGFYRVSGRRACTMRLKVCCVCWIEPCPLVAGSDERLLRFAAGCCDGLGLAILIDTALSDDGANRVTISKRVVQPLENDRGRSFTTAITICSTVKGKRLAVFAKKPENIVSQRTSEQILERNQALTSWKTWS